MKKYLIILGTIAVISSVLIVVKLVDNRAKANLIQEIEEKTCEVIVRDIYKQAENDIANQILTIVNEIGQVQIGSIILVPQQNE